MQIGALTLRSTWAACALASLIAIVAPAQAAPLARGDAATSADTTADADTADAYTAEAAGAAVGVAASTNTSPGAKAASTGPVTAKNGGPPSVPLQTDLGSSVREVTKPLLEELAHSDVVEAVRAMDIKPEAVVDSGLTNAESDGQGRDPTARRRNWDGTEKTATPTPGIDRDPQLEKARTSVLLGALIEDVKPWAIGAVALYILGTMARFGLAYRKRSVQRKIDRRKHHRRRSGRRSESRHGQP
ncbi:MAG: hypothetical protein JWP29_3304 [Rhodoferax sp.]|nr:hypothetical protein [Rhodoferax sp.]